MFLLGGTFFQKHVFRDWLPLLDQKCVLLQLPEQLLSLWLGPPSLATVARKFASQVLILPLEDTRLEIWKWCFSQRNLIFQSLIFRFQPLFFGSVWPNRWSELIGICLNPGKTGKTIIESWIISILLRKSTEPLLIFMETTVKPFNISHNVGFTGKSSNKMTWHVSRFSDLGKVVRSKIDAAKKAGP